MCLLTIESHGPVQLWLKLFAKNVRKHTHSARIFGYFFFQWLLISTTETSLQHVDKFHLISYEFIFLAKEILFDPVI